MERMNNKTAMLITFLRKNGRTRMADLAKVMNCSERSVRVHIELSKKLGYEITSHAGKANPGYELHEITLSDDEWLRIKEFDINIYNKLNKILIEKV